jgi:NAD-dependent DNA ligase
MLYRTDDIQNNPFNGRRVAYTGTFTIDSRSLSKKLKEWGADVNNAITKSTNIVLIGENPNADKINQLEARIHDGFHIKKLYQEDLNNIFNFVNWEDYLTEIDVVKSLDFTIEHFNQHHFRFDEGVKNKIAGKELYFCGGFRKDKGAIEQITGNLAAWLNYVISPQVQIFVLSDSTLEKLKNGEKDESILKIQNYYNKNKGTKFDFMFMSENDILSFVQLWSSTHGDEVLYALYERYMKSEY